MVAAAAAIRCGGAPPSVASPILPPPPTPRTEPIATDGSFWEDVPVSVLSVPAGMRLPFDEKALAGAAAYEALAQGERARVREAGLVVHRGDSRDDRLAPIYVKARADKTPYVITLDTLFALVIGAYAATIAEVEATVTEPALRSMLPKLDARLAGEQRSARSDTAPAYVLARSILGVARALLEKDYRPDASIAAGVRAEVQRIGAHLGPAPSELLGQTVDYGEFDLQGALTSSDSVTNLAAFRARTWLAQAAMVLAVRAPARPLVDVTTQRTHARAAMLLTHALAPDASPGAAEDWTRIADAEAFLFGPVDDWDPRLFGRLASDAQVDLRDGATFVNVAKVDQLRLRAGAQEGRSRVNDLAAASPTAGALESPIVTFRFLGSSAPPDSVALAKLVAPSIGSHFGTSTPITLHDGARTLPTALDLAVAVGSIDAREILHETGDDAYERFEAVIGALAAKALPPEPPARHRTVYLSLLDALAAYLSPSAEDVAQPASAGPAWRRRKVATALGGWARLRHATLPFSGARAHEIVDDPPSSQDGTVAFVEPHPEAIARLLGATRQLRRGLVAGKSLSAQSATHVLLERLEALLLDAFDLALREAGSAPFGAKEQRTLDAMPQAIANLEKRLGKPGAAPAIAVAHGDVVGKRFLEVGTGFVEEAIFVLRVPGVPNPIAFVGVHVPFLERAQSLRTTDAVFRSQLEKTRVPTPAWQRSFREE